MILFNNKNKKIKKLQQENENNKIIIERLFESIFCNNKLTDEEVDILYEEYPDQMNKIILKNNLKEKISAKIGFKN